MALTSNQKIDDIIIRLQTAANPVDKNEIAAQRGRLAKLTLSAVQDDEHDLHQQFTELKEIVRQPGDWPILFNPWYGSSRPDRARFWPLQLLLFNAATDMHTQKALCSFLDMTEARLRKALVPAGKTINNWNLMLLATNFIQAARQLRWPPPAELPFRIAGTKLIYDGFQPLALPDQQRKLLEALIDKVGQQVTHDQLNVAGIAKPNDRLYDLRKRVRDAGIPELNITTGTRTITLIL